MCVSSSGRDHANLLCVEDICCRSEHCATIFGLYYPFQTFQGLLVSLQCHRTLTEPGPPVSLVPPSTVLPRNPLLGPRNTSGHTSCLVSCFALSPLPCLCVLFPETPLPPGPSHCILHDHVQMCHPGCLPQLLVGTSGHPFRGPQNISGRSATFLGTLSVPEAPLSLCYHFSSSQHLTRVGQGADTR